MSRCLAVARLRRARSVTAAPAWPREIRR